MLASARAPHQTFLAPHRRAQAVPGTARPSLLQSANHCSTPLQSWCRLPQCPPASAHTRDVARPQSKAVVPGCPLVAGRLLPCTSGSPQSSHTSCTSSCAGGGDLWRCRHELRSSASSRHSMGHAHRRTATTICECPMASCVSSANACASEVDRPSRRRRNSSKSCAEAGTYWLSSRQATGALMSHSSAGALHITSAKSGSTLRLMQPRRQGEQQTATLLPVGVQLYCAH